MRSVLYRFPDLDEFEAMIFGTGEAELELGLPSGEAVEDGEWVLAIFELGHGRRATSAACRAAVGPEGSRLIFEPRDWKRLAEFAHYEARHAEPVDRESEVPITAKSVAPPPHVTSRPPAPGKPSRVLIVDDDPDIREVVSAMLEAVGLEVTAAESAEDALEIVLEKPFDLAVFDWNLPKMTGVELCRMIRQEPALAKLPVLFLTANASSQDMVDAFASGADDYVVKPFRAPELGARIFSLLRRSRMGGS